MLVAWATYTSDDLDASKICDTGQGFAHVFKVKTLAINDKYRLHFLARKEVGAKGVAVLHSES